MLDQHVAKPDAFPPHFDDDVHYTRLRRNDDHDRQFRCQYVAIAIELAGVRRVHGMGLSTGIHEEVSIIFAFDDE